VDVLRLVLTENIRAVVVEEISQCLGWAAKGIPGETAGIEKRVVFIIGIGNRIVVIAHDLTPRTSSESCST